MMTSMVGRHVALLAAALAGLGCIPFAVSQLLPPDAGGIAMGHVHLNVSDIAAQREFWIKQFDAKPVEHNGVQGVIVPGMLILFTHKAPTHGSEGTVLDHFGFKVHNRDEMVARCRAAGLTITRVFTGSEGFPNAYVLGPDGVKVEMQEESSLTVWAVAQHFHFLLPAYMDLRAWYLNAFHLPGTTRGPHPSADMPGINLTFANTSLPVDKPTKDGMIDHLGFEVKNLAAWLKTLEAAGIRIDASYPEKGPLGIPSATLTDPRGVTIELTEGLTSWR